MDKTEIRAAIEVQQDICIGCSHCIKVCPTEALRVINGKATLYDDWCVDCGKCYRVCPTRAIRVVEDDLRRIFKYNKRILLIPSVFYAQFDGIVPIPMVNQILSDIGFTEICLVEQGVDTLIDEINQYIQTAEEKPIISSFCPSVIRLIQVRFPSLVDRIALLVPPIEMTAAYYRKKYHCEGCSDDDFGIFYITPCAGKIASIKFPLGGYSSPINGVINMDTIYNRVLLAYKHREIGNAHINYNSSISSKGLLWATTGGEASEIEGKAMAIDGINNVIEFLEKLEDDEVGDGIDYLELRMCDESCSGGILSIGNRFLMADYLRNKSKEYPSSHPLYEEYKQISQNKIHIESIPSKSMVKYDKDITKAIEKMERAKELETLLPGIDCGACGAPSCEALSADIVRDKASLDNCIFRQAALGKEGEMPIEKSIAIMEGIWGENRFIINKTNKK